ncbi:MAG: hypothetical protein JRJ65_16195, partial [Deltaproteobacteria bacterium]|nr:hypothetical protein [Deltaproteobacteria bacterium]
MKKLAIISILLLLATITINAQQNDFQKITGPYLGQKPPGMMTPENQTSLESYKIKELSVPDDRQLELSAEIVKTVEEWLPGQLKSLNIPGAVVSVFDNHHVIWKKTYGYIGSDNSR